MIWTHTDYQRVAILVAVLLASQIALIGLASAGHNTTYYNNSSGVVQPDTPRNATLDNIVGVAVDLAPDLIGTGERDPSGTGFQGVLLTAIVFASVSLATMAGTSVGPIGGTILGSTVAYGLVDLGFAPEWTKLLLLFGLGIVAYVGFRRVLQ